MRQSIEKYRNLYIWGHKDGPQFKSGEISTSGKTFKQEDLDSFIVQNLLCDILEELKISNALLGRLP